MEVKRSVQAMAVFWSYWLRKSYTASFTSRPLSTLANDCGYQILKSPPLVSLDLPDIWTCDSTISNAPPIHKCNSFDGDVWTDHILLFGLLRVWGPCIEASEQTARVIDGKSIAEEIISGIAIHVRRMKEAIGKVPGLAVILVGQRRDSQTYVRKKIKACEEAGIKFVLTELPDKCTEDEVCDAVSSFNKNPSVHGIIVQLPLPQHMNEGKILDVLSLEKDVDGFHPVNIGNLAMRGREPLFISCTPKGCVELLLRADVDIRGKKAVVIGRSNIVGLPASLLLQRHHATVSVINACTKNPGEITRDADIVITAVGVPNLVQGSWLKHGAVVIDVGTHPVEDPTCEHGYCLKGDVCYEEAIRVASAITPVPGGVGPMTVAMLLSNTLESAKRKYNFP